MSIVYGLKVCQLVRMEHCKKRVHETRPGTLEVCSIFATQIILGPVWHRLFLALAWFCGEWNFRSFRCGKRELICINKITNRPSNRPNKQATTTDTHTHSGSPKITPQTPEAEAVCTYSEQCKLATRKWHHCSMTMLIRKCASVPPLPGAAHAAAGASFGDVSLSVYATTASVRLLLVSEVELPVPSSAHPPLWQWLAQNVWNREVCSSSQSMYLPAEDVAVRSRTQLICLPSPTNKLNLSSLLTLPATLQQSNVTVGWSSVHLPGVQVQGVPNSLLGRRKRNAWESELCKPIGWRREDIPPMLLLVWCPYVCMCWPVSCVVII